MENKKQKIFLSFFLAVIIFLPFTVFAGVVPCANSEHPEPCTLCHLIVGFWGLIDYGFKIFVFVAVTGLVIAGIMYIVSAGNEEMMKTAKNFITQILTGFAIILGAWLLIFVVMNYFGVKGDLGIQAEAWNKFKCSTESSVVLTTTTPTLTKKLCSEIEGAVCAAPNSCPADKQVSNAVCPGNEACIKNCNTAKPSCEAWGGKCRLESGIISGCKSGESQNNDYSCQVLNICCFSGSPIAPSPIEKCQDKEGICAQCNTCPATYQKSYFCANNGCCCIGYPNAKPL